MDLGIFLPTATAGYIASSSAPHFDLSFDAILDVTQRAEALGFASALCMAKFRGPEGDTDYWESAYEAFTLTGALLARTSTIRIFATAGMPSLNPALVARMGATLDAVAPGRFGINLVTGWNPKEYEQMGVWPGDDYFGYRYEYASEYVRILRELWGTGRSDFRGAYFALDDAICSPRPETMPVIVGAASSKSGVAFAAANVDVDFMTGLAADDSARDLATYRASGQSETTAYLLVMVILGDTDEQAQRLVDHYNAHSDQGALAGRKAAGSRNTAAAAAGAAGDTTGGTAARMMTEVAALSPGEMWCGSPATIAAKLRAVRDSGLYAGVMLQFDDWTASLDRFGAEVMPLLAD
ncbi:LLM class flavin-dependent oxidoreductase [Frondihabitans australicus]|uniref:Pyrimidine oxygenase n=1 Tax=Frondihabitans australicus TaxID=386892 RepID=A0A495IEF6_9MICO|nr:LLM class flavin-dependent oxidoreductase [Frondihabitans australicus]RKR74377.1 pyrimidine oxygenase [Frondihabitans australicus]